MQIVLRQALVIGYKPSDIETGKATECVNFLVSSDQCLLDEARTTLAYDNMLEEK